jgi:ABC-type transport system involved in multi-copper enzyme maturation permease subunit
MTAITVPTAPTAATPTVTAPSGLHVLRANVRAEWTKLRSVRSTVWTLLATVGLAVGFGALIGASQMSSWDNLEPSERLRFDPTSFSLSGLFLAQLAVGVLGVLVISSEYATGQIRATFGATPQRLTVLAAKAITFTAVVVVTGVVASFGAFSVGQAIFASKDLGASISDPGVLRAVFGGALYLAGVGLLGVGLGTILRRTAGAVAALVGLLFILPIVTGFLPASFQETVGKYFPAQAGMSVWTVVPTPEALSPWAGFAVLGGYGVVTLAIGGLLLVRRDA